jgi:hypothetical protein
MSEAKPPFATHSDIQIDRALDTLRLETESLNTPLTVENSLMAAFAAAHAKKVSLTPAKPPREKRRDQFARVVSQWFAPGFAVAASVVMSSWMMLSPLSQAVDDAGLASMSALADAGDASNPFIALQSLERIALEPAPRLIAANVPRSSLAAYGVPINPETAGQSVRTEMLVAANGQPLAMRFLP